jgi:hypothetical protein
MLIRAFSLFMEVAEHHPEAMAAGRGVGVASVVCWVFRVNTVSSAVLRLSPFLCPAMVARREKERAFSAADLEALCLLALLRRALRRLGCFFTELIFSTRLLPPMAGAVSLIAGISSPSV